MTSRFIVADVFDGLAQLDDNSVDLVFTSPPFLALRSYLPADHPDKGKEIGLEGTPGEFLDRLLDVVEACDRVLAPHGSLVFELGDTYAGSGGAGGDYNEGGLRDGQEKFDGGAARARRAGDEPRPRLNRTRAEGGWPLDKCKVMVPELFGIALAYGFNPLTGRTTPRWRVRNVIAWCRPNPPVGALGDKVRPATSYLTVACKARDRYFDLDAVREPHSVAPETMRGTTPRGDVGSRKPGGDDKYPEGVSRPKEGNPAGAPPLDYWVIPTESYRGSHYATFPTALVTKPVKMMCPERVCRVCGEPSRRITERDWQGYGPSRPEPETLGWCRPEPETVGWSDCGCAAPKLDGLQVVQAGTLPQDLKWRPGVVLDPFAGSGTTLAVATGHGRDAIGIDLDLRNADLARERCGMFLDLEVLGSTGNLEDVGRVSAP